MVRRAEFGLRSDRRPARCRRFRVEAVELLPPNHQTPCPVLSKASTKAKFSQGQSPCAPCSGGGALYRSVLCRSGAVRCGVLSRSSVEVLCCRTASWTSHGLPSEIPNRQALMLVMVVVSGHQQALSGAISWHPIHDGPKAKALVPDLHRVPSSSRH